MRSLNNILVIIYGLFFCCSGCGDDSGAAAKVRKNGRAAYVEVAPGKWLEIRRLDRSNDQRGTGLTGLTSNFVHTVLEGGENHTEMVIPWSQSAVYWKSVDIPVSLREFQGNLYLIGFDRETDRKKWRFRYYALTNDHFVEIKQDKYPKSIVVQNLWFNDSRELDATLNLDPDGKYFTWTLTATLWYLFETGKEYHQLQGYVTESDRSILRQFKQKYKPLKLNQIIHDKDAFRAPVKSVTN